ncbi:MAG: hypothetical protein WBG14_12195, partial [Rhodococcus sp. (in: high G+C Gram-positive bacteria)]
RSVVGWAGAMGPSFLLGGSSPDLEAWRVGFTYLVHTTVSQVPLTKEVKMKLSWAHPVLEGCCTSAARLRAAAGGQVAAAEDLLHLVSQAPRLRDLATFRCVLIHIHAKGLILAIEEFEMHAQPLEPDGALGVVTPLTATPEHNDARSLLVQDVRVHGRSILELAS